MFAMFTQGPALLAASVTLLCSLLLPFVIKPMLVRLGIMDVPSERSSHSKPVLRGLGLAVLIAIVVGGAVGVGTLFLSAMPALGRDILLVVLLGSVLAGLLGLGEDLRGVSVKTRSVLTLLIGLLVPAALVWLFHTEPLGASAVFGRGEAGWQRDLVAGWFHPAGSSVMMSSDPVGAVRLPLWLGIVLVPYAVLFVSSFINVANFMDGLNGISGFHGVIAGLAFGAAGWFTGLAWLVVMGLVIACGFAGFLPWNLTKPGAFLGDVGSYLLGGAVAITSFAALLAGVPLLATIGPMVIYFGDVAVTLVKRVRAGNRWDEPHKEHTYQRIQQRGYSHVAASGLTALATLATSVLGVLSIFAGTLGTIVLFAAGFAVLALYLALPKLLPQR